MAYYINNEVMLMEIIKYKQTGHISEELGNMFIKIATGISNLYKFRTYTYKEDMISEAYTTMCIYASKFDETKYEVPNPFSYFSQIAYNSCRKIAKNEKKHQRIRDYYLMVNGYDIYLNDNRQEGLRKLLTVEKKEE